MFYQFVKLIFGALNYFGHREKKLTLRALKQFDRQLFKIIRFYNNKTH